MEEIVFYSVAKYCDYAAKMTIKLEDREIRTTRWDNVKKRRSELKRYLTKKRAKEAYIRSIGKAILDGWKVLSPYS